MEGTVLGCFRVETESLGRNLKQGCLIYALMKVLRIDKVLLNSVIFQGEEFGAFVL